MAFVKLNWKPTSKELRQFGAIFLTGFLLIGAVKYFGLLSWFFNKDETFGLIFIVIGLIVGGTALLVPRLSLPFYWLWLGIAFVLGNIMSRVIVTLVFFLAVTPLGLLGRLIGRDKLQLKKTSTQTYWHDISLPKEIEKYERQF